MAGEINAKFARNVIIKQSSNSNSTTSNTPEASQSKSIWQVFAEKDKDQSGIITADESTEISGWKEKQSSAQNLLKNIIEEKGATGDYANNLFAKYSRDVIGGFTKKITEILSSFTGLKTGSKEEAVALTEGLEDANTPPDQALVQDALRQAQDEINRMAQFGINKVVSKFDTEFEEYKKEVSNSITIDDSTNEAASQTSSDKITYEKIGKRQVNDTKQDVYKNGDQYYILRDGNNYEEIFLVHDSVLGKKKFVTQDIKEQLELDKDKSGDIDTEKVKIDGKDVFLIRNGGEKINGHKTYSDIEGNKYIRSNGEYFRMNSPEGILLQQKNSECLYQRDPNTNENKKIIYVGKEAYEVGSHKLNEKAKEIRNSTPTEMEEDVASHDANTMVKEKTDEVKAKHDTLIAALGEVDKNTEKPKLDKALEDDIQATIANATDNYSVITIATENAIKEIQVTRDKAEAEAKLTLGEGGAAKDAMDTANKTVRSWGEKSTKSQMKKYINGNNFTGKDANDVINTVLKGMGFNDNQIAKLAGTDFRKSIVTANPSVFNSDGNVYDNADMNKLDFPTAAAIKHVFMDGPAPAAASNADTIKPEQKTLKSEKDYTLDDLNEIAKRRNDKNYVKQNDDGTFTMYIYEKNGRNVTPMTGTKAAIIQTLKEMGTDTSVSVKENASTSTPASAQNSTPGTPAASRIISKPQEKSGVTRMIPKQENVEISDNIRVVGPPQNTPLGKPRDEDLTQTVTLVQDNRTGPYSGLIKVGGRTLKVNTRTFDKKQAEQIVRQAVVQELGFATGDNLKINVIGF